MRLVKKSLRRDEWNFNANKKFSSLQVFEQEFIGTIGFITFSEVKEPFVIEYPNRKVCLIDNGYQWLQVAPKEQNWWLTVLFDEKGMVLESYFDITKSNEFLDEFNPTFLDMFLDVVLIPNQDPILLDEDELEEAFQQELITKEEYDLAFLVAKKIVQGYNSKRNQYYDFINWYYQILKGGTENEI